jgi:hypothetical protein
MGREVEMGLLAKLTDPKLAEPDVEDDEILCVDAEGNVYTEGFTMGAGK